MSNVNKYRGQRLGLESKVSLGEATLDDVSTLKQIASKIFAKGGGATQHEIDAAINIGRMVSNSRKPIVTANAEETGGVAGKGLHNYHKDFFSWERP